MKEKRNLILTLAGQGVSSLGTNLYSFAISFYILSVTGSSTSFALSLILSTLPRVLLNPFIGNLVDRVNKKLLIVAADTVCGLIMIGLYMMTYKQSLSLPMIYSASLLLNISYVFLNTSYAAAFGSIVTEKLLTKLNSFQQTLQAAIQIAAPVMGGLIYALIDIRVFILLNGISFFISAISELFIDFKFKSKLKTEDKKQSGFMDTLVEGFKYALSQKAHLNLAIYALIINFFMSFFSVIIPYTLVTLHGFESKMVGYIDAAFPIGMLVTSIIIGSKNLKFTRSLFSKGILFFGALMFLFTLPSLPFIQLGQITPIYYGLLFALLASDAVAINVPLGVRFQSTVDEAYRGRFFGLLGMMSEGIMPIAYLLTGLLITIVPTYVILYAAAIFLLLISIHIKGNKALDMDGEIKTEEVIQDVQVL